MSVVGEVWMGGPRLLDVEARFVTLGRAVML